jgi:hypothetical protein
MISGSPTIRAEFPASSETPPLGAPVALDASTMRKSDIAIPVPCTVDWRSMTPADKGRFCGDCKKVVRDLSQMTETDASALVRSAHGGDLCVRYLHDKHGKVFFEEDLARRAGLLPRSFLNRARRTAVAAASFAVPVFLQGCGSDPFAATASAVSSNPDHKDQDELQPNMGGATPQDDPQPDPGNADAAPDAGPRPATDAAPPDPDAGVDGGPASPS